MNKRRMLSISILLIIVGAFCLSFCAWMETQSMGWDNIKNVDTGSVPVWFGSLTSWLFVIGTCLLAIGGITFLYKI